jgi:hypothetical protein
MSTFAARSTKCQASELPAPIFATHSPAPHPGLQAFTETESHPAPNEFAHDFSSVPVHASTPAERIPGDQIRRQGPGLGGLPPQPISGTFFCNPPLYDASQIRNALSTAKTWVGLVIPILDLFRMGRLSGTRETAVRIALRENFNITDPFPRFSLGPRAVDTILNNFNLIETALNQPMQFYCTHACLPGDLAWVLSNPSTFGLPPGIINICPEFFGCDPLKQASTIIHERAHEALGANDIAYEVSGLYDALSTMSALNNADSYAVFARQVYHNGIHRPGMSCSIMNSRIPDFHLTEPRFERPRPQPPSLLNPPSLFPE